MTIISKKGFCPGCMMTKKVLDAQGTKYTVKHIDTMEQRNHIMDLGFRSYPIVEPDDKLDDSTFCGFHPEILHKMPAQANV